MSDWQNEFKNPIDFLLQENGDFLLKEDGGKIVLNQTGESSSLWENTIKH